MMKQLLSLLPKLSPTAVRRVVLVLMAFTAMVCLGCEYEEGGGGTSGGVGFGGGTSGVSRGPMIASDFNTEKTTSTLDGSPAAKICPCCGAERDSERSATHAVLDCGQHCRAQMPGSKEKYHDPCQYCGNCAAEGQHGDGVCNTQPLVSLWWPAGGSLLDEPDACPSCGQPIGEGHYVTEPDHGGYTREEQTKTIRNDYYDCGQCDFRTDNSAEAAAHENANRGRVAHVCTEESHTNRKTKYGYKCPYEGCGFTCTTEAERQAHLDSLDFHEVAAEGQYKCPNIGNGCPDTSGGLFSTKSAFVAHCEKSPACVNMKHTNDGLGLLCLHQDCANATPLYETQYLSHLNTHNISYTGTVAAEAYYCSCGAFREEKMTQDKVQEHLDKMDAHRSAFAEVQQTAIGTSSSTTYTYDCGQCDFTTTDPDEAAAHEAANGYLPAHTCSPIGEETTETVTVYPCNDTACSNHTAPPTDLMAALEHHAANDGTTYCKDSPPDYELEAQIMEMALNGESGTIITPAGQVALDAQLRPGEHAETKVKDLFTATPVGDNTTPFTPTEPGTVVGAAEVTINAVDENGNARPLTIASGNDRAFGHTVPLHLPADVDPRYVNAYRVESMVDGEEAESSTTPSTQKYNFSEATKAELAESIGDMVRKKKVKVAPFVGAGMRYTMTPEVFARPEYGFEFEANLEYQYEFEAKVKGRDTTVTGAGYKHKRAENNENRMRLGVNFSFSGTSWSDGNSLYLFIYEPPVEEDTRLTGSLIAAIAGVAVLAATGGAVYLTRKKKG